MSHDVKILQNVGDVMCAVGPAPLPVPQREQVHLRFVEAALARFKRTLPYVAAWCICCTGRHSGGYASELLPS